MKFNYTKRMLILNFVLAVLWMCVGIGKMLDTQTQGWTDYLFLVIGLLYAAMFLYQYFLKYFELTSEKITLMGFPSKTIFFKDLTEIKYYAGDFSFKTKEKTIRISKDQIDKNQLPEFERQFEKIRSTYQL